MALVLGGAFYQALPSAQSGKRALVGSATRDQALAYGEQQSRAQTEGFFLYPRYSVQQDAGYPSLMLRDAPASPEAEGMAPMVAAAVPLEAGEPAAIVESAALDPTAAGIVAIEYEVVEGDNVYSIAKRFGLGPDTLAWANNLKNLDLLSIGQRLVVPAIDGVLHVVGAGDVSNDSHHQEGILKFPKGAEQGSKTVELVIRDVGGVKERPLRWDLQG